MKSILTESEQLFNIYHTYTKFTKHLTGGISFPNSENYQLHIDGEKQINGMFGKFVLQCHLCYALGQKDFWFHMSPCYKG